MSALGGSGVPLTPQGAPLTPEEQQLIARLFSDPFYFPLQFKTWLEWFIENAQGNIAGGTSAGGGGGGGGGVVPIGGIALFGSGSLPTGFLWCNGAAYSRTGYNSLYAVIGTAFGVGDGSTTFNVPDLDGRTIVGWAQSGGHADVSSLGATEIGITKANRRPKHRHTPHTHPLSNAGLVNYKDGTSGDRSWSATAGGVDGGATMNAVDGGSGHSTDSLDAPAFLTLAGIIRYI